MFWSTSYDLWDIILATLFKGHQILLQAKYLSSKPKAFEVMYNVNVNLDLLSAVWRP